MAEQPKYVESLRGEIAVLDRKIDDFNEKFDHKVDRLNENLQEVETALTEVSTTLKTFIQRVDKTGDRQWQLFLAVIGLTAAFLVASAASTWQVQQHGRQLEKLEGAITRLDGSVVKIPNLEQQIGKLEKSVEKISGLEATIVRLDQSLGHHGQQLEKLEKSVEKIVGLESAITRLDGSVARLANLDKTLPDLAVSIKENLALSRAIDRRLVELESARTRVFRLNLDPAHMKPSPRPGELVFEWELEDRYAERIPPDHGIRMVLPPVLENKTAPTTEVVRQGGRTILRLRLVFPNGDAADEAIRRLLADPARRQEVLVDPDPSR